MSGVDLRPGRFEPMHIARGVEEREALALLRQMFAQSGKALGIPGQCQAQLLVVLQ